MSGVRRVDFLVVGGGVIGLALALALKRSFGDCSVAVIEKEPACGLHASGRNSGVLHAGFYYGADTAKARFCREGNRWWSDYALERGLEINRCGKLVVAAGAGELPVMEELLRRAGANGVRLERLTPQEAREVEPRVRTAGCALYAPQTATIDPSAAMAALAADADAAGVAIHLETAFLSRRGKRIHTSRGPFDAGYVVNAAGLHADRIAREYGFCQGHCILPFKGLYLYAREGFAPVRTNIYPVPDLDYPFLGVHFTVDVRGRCKIGPTALPALWREHYRGLENFRPGEALTIVGREIALLCSNRFGFRRLACAELRKCSRRRLTALASRMLAGVGAGDFRRWGRPGIRAQLVDLRRNRLEMDFRFEGDEGSFHVLNAVSPAFTCAVPFARYLVSRIKELLA